MPFWTEEFWPAFLLTMNEVLWVIAQSGGGSVPRTDVFTGPASSVTLSHTPTTNSPYYVYRGGARQVPTVDYTVSGTTVTPTNALLANEVFLIDYVSN